jgi:TolA-binding protein
VGQARAIGIDFTQNLARERRPTRIGIAELVGRRSRSWFSLMAALLARACPTLLRACLILLVLLLASVAAAQESSAEAKTLYADAANLQNNGAFDLAVEEWQKFLKEFAKDPLAPKAKHYLGVCLMQQKKYPEAVAAFDAVQKDNPKFELLEDTLLNLGWSQYQLALKDKSLLPTAADSFTALLDKFPEGKFSDQALYFLGEANYQQGKKAEAAAAYSRLVKEQEKSPLRCDALYALGVAQEELGKYPEAGAAYDLYLADCAKNELVTEVRMRKAETVLQAGDFAAAEKAFGEVAAVKDFALADHALYRQAFCLTKLDKFLEAGALYARIVAMFPKSERVNIADAALAAGRCFYRGEKLDDAAKWFDQAIADGGAGAAEAAHWRARIYLRNKQPQKASDLAVKFLPAAGTGEYAAKLRMDQADALYETPEKRGESVALYAKIAADHPQDELAPQALYNAAYTALELKKYDDGQKFAAEFLKSFAGDKLVPDVKYVQAECFLQQNKAAEAEAVYTDLTTNYAQHAEIGTWRLRHALSLYLQKKYDAVVALLSPQLAQLKTAQQTAEAQYLIGISQFYADKFAEAEAALTAALAAAPQWRQADETLLVLSRAQRKLDKNAAAVASIEKLLKDFPASKLADQAHYRLGEYFYAGDDFKQAAAEYQTVAAKFPESTFVPYALYGEGWSLLKQKDYAGANKAFDALLAKFAEHQLAAETHFARAMSRRNAGNFPGAVEDAAAFLKTNPAPEQAADALYEKGLAEVGLKKNDAAAATFEKVLEVNPKYAGVDKVLYELGWANKSQKKEQEALAYFARLANEHPDSPLAAEAYFHVAEDRYDQKQYADAAKIYQLAKAKANGGELGEKATYKLGWANFQQKQYAPAFEQFSEQVTKYGTGPLANDARFMKAESLFREEKYEEAWPAYQEAVKNPASTPAMEVLTLLHGGQSASQLKQYGDALKLFAAIPEKFPDTPYLPEAMYESGWAKQNLNKIADAQQDYAFAAEKSRAEVGCRARFMLGELLFEQKNYAEAIKEFQRAMYTYGGENAAAETKNWQAKSGYEAGRCAEVQIASAKDAAAKAKLIAEAKKFYGFVAEKHSTHETAGEEKKRLAALAKL